MPLQNRNSIVYKKTFFNPFWKFEVITKPLSSGRYNFKLITEDDYKNQSEGIDDGITINSDILPPFAIEITTNGSLVTLNWDAPANHTPTGYVVYGNGGGGLGVGIDRSSVLGTVLYGTNTITIGPLSDGVWIFTVESYTGALESINNYAVDVTLPSIAEIPPAPTYDETIYSYRDTVCGNKSVGKIYVAFVWEHGSKAEYFRLYHDNGSGNIDWENYLRWSRVNGFVQEYTTSQIYTGATAQEFKFVLRAESADGIIDTNIKEYTVMLEGVEPDDVLFMDIESKD